MAKKACKQDEAFIEQAYALFDDFYAKSTELRQKCERNEEFYKANHYYDKAPREPGEPQPVTPVLFSTIESMLADLMDKYPEPVLLPQEEGDETLASQTEDVLRYILKRRDYRQVYRKKCRQALIKGTSVQEVFWDASLYGGLGDVNVRAWDIKQFLMDPMCEDFQQGRACFKFAFVTPQWLQARYPWAMPLLRPDTYVRSGQDEDEIMVIEYWYKTGADADARVHMALLAGHVLLEKSETERPQGMYAHGKYPFIVEPLYPIEGEAAGLSAIDVLKNMQIYADALDQIVLKNAMMSGKVKMLINRNAELEEDALCDWNREVVRGSRIDDASVRFLQPASLNPYFITHYQSKLESIKEESGQTMFTRGETGRGVTAATAILALQEAGNKRSRLLVEQMFDGFEALCRMLIEVIAENYDETRTFRIRGEKGQAYNVKMKGEKLKHKSREGLERFVEFDVSVHVQQQSPYQTLVQNELAFELLQNGIIGPREALSMLTFEGKDKVVAMLEQSQAEQAAQQAQASETQAAGMDEAAMMQALQQSGTAAQ